MASDDRFAARVFQLTVLAVLGYLLFLIVQPFLGPIFWSVLLALILFPLNERLRVRLPGRPGLSATILTLGVTICLVVPAVAVGVAFARQGLELAHRLSATAGKYGIAGIQDLLRLPAIGNLAAWLENTFGLNPARVEQWMIQVMTSLTNFLVAHGRDVLLGAFGLIGNLTVMLFTLFFCFRDGDAVAARLVRLLPIEGARKQRLVAHLRSVTEAVVLGTVITAVAQGGLVAVAFWITGLPTPIVFGVLTAIASFVPLVGTALVIAPAAIYLAATEGIWWKAVFMVAWGVLVAGSADNVLKPLLIAGRAEIGTLPVFFGVIGGLAAFGMAGLFLGPVIVALGLVLLQFAEETARARSARAAAGASAPGS